ncbi:hypothetical protein DVA67_020335 [Solirubrobacter sp. CPCC 204708]|uniref:DUF4129 domain-containing protein n=1 Tax=Solirubrobacter deserti TaxID=2282478 RepID=A0ABT4RTN7_9ACTN|nr:hypothetical protein [Solirubrobacter deserti]MBE2318341.1 hypothetical protein [Solirubrobacter deserti]MDA0141939.1 hypothetical protein [Solirubrobacter deserti]
MSAPPQVVPGTRPIVGEDFVPSLPRHREDPAAAERGYSAAARAARVDAVARDLAAATQRGLVGPGPVTTALTDEISQLTRSGVALELRAHVPERAAAVAGVAGAQEAVELAEQAERRAVAERERLRVEEPDEPATGTRLTHPLVALLMFPILFFLEVQLSAPAVRPALETDTRTAVQVTAALALLLTAGAELGGLGLGSLVTHHRRLARLTLVVLALATIGCVGWAVVALATGREDNLAYRDQLRSQASAGQTTGRGFGAAAPQGDARPSAEAAQDGPNLAFVVPITLAALLAAMTLSMRATVAHPHRGWRKRDAAAETRRREAVEKVAAQRVRLTEASRRLDASDLHVGAFSEREAAAAAELTARLRIEYERACHARGVRALELALPEPPSAQEIALALLDPQRAISTQPVVVPTVVGGNPPAPAPEPEPVTPDVPFVTVEEPAPEPAPDPIPPRNSPAGWSWLDQEPV